MLLISYAQSLKLNNGEYEKIDSGQCEAGNMIVVYADARRSAERRR